jgi:uncharacterized protein
VPRSGLLIDTGPLVAILNDRDAYHEVCLAEAKRLRGNFCTSWAVVTETAYLLKREANAVQRLLAWICTSELLVLPLNLEGADGIAHILHAYADQDFDFADATLMHLAEREGLETVFTIDYRHFAVFRTKLRKHLNIVPLAT